MLADITGLDIFWVALSAIAGAVLAIVTIYTTVIKPTRVDHAKREAERLERRRAVDGWIDGGRQIDGTITVGAPEKLHDVEIATQDLTEQVKGVVKGQGLLEKRMDEANGTGRRTEAAVASISGNLTALTDLVKGIVEAGVGTKLDLDKEAHKVATLASESQDELLEAIHSPSHHESA